MTRSGKYAELKGWAFISPWVLGFLVFTLIFGVEKEPAATASILIWLITFASCSLMGLPLLLREGTSMGELRKMAAGARDEERARLEADAERDAGIGIAEIEREHMAPRYRKDESEERPS